LHLPGSTLDATLAPFGAAKPLPAAVYRDESLFAFELAEIFGRAWLCAGRGSDVGEPGSFIRPPLPWDVVIARGDDRELRAFHNVCRHRASPVVSVGSGMTRAFACPYHGWTYDLDGRLRHAPEAPPGFDCAKHPLLSLETGRWNDFVFCRRAPAPIAGVGLRGGMPPWLKSTDLRHLVRAHSAEWTTHANWKLCAENFQESHHFTRVHQKLEALTPSNDAASVLRDGPWMGGTMAINERFETVSESGRRNGRPFIVAPALRRTVHDAMHFPGWLTSLQPDYLLSYRLVPEAVDRTRIAFDVFVHPEAPRGEAELDDLRIFWARVNAEDKAVCEAQQRGMRTPGYEPGCFASCEDGVHAFQSRVARAYAERAS
jgi:glycine betaine catabolism A